MFFFSLIAKHRHPSNSALFCVGQKFDWRREFCIFGRLLYLGDLRLASKQLADRVRLHQPW